MATEERVVLVAQLQDELSAPLQQAEQAIEGVTRATDQARDAQGRYTRTLESVAQSVRTGSTAQGAMAAATERVTQTTGQARDENGRFAAATQLVTTASGQLATTQGQLAVATGHTLDAAGRLRDENGRYVAGAGQAAAATETSTRSVGRLGQAISRLTGPMRTVAGNVRTQIQAPFTAAGNRISSMIPTWISRPFQAATRTVASATSAMVSGVTNGFTTIATGAGRAASAVGSFLGTNLKNMATAGAKSIGLVGAALGGIAIVGGMKRLGSIEEATAKLDGLGHSGKTIENIMSNALEAVDGTAFGLGDAATIAAGAVAAGIKPGKELTRVLSLVGDGATIAGMEMDQMGSLFNKVAASGKLQGDVIQSLQDSGIPILQLVAEEMNVTAEEAQKMASDGKVSFETFTIAMEKGMGGAAKKSGATFAGAMANTKAALGRIGATFLEPFRTLAKEVFNVAIPLFNSINGALKPVMEIVDTKLAAITPKLTVFSDGLIAVGQLLGTGNFSGKLREAFGWEEDSPIIDFINRLSDGFGGFMEKMQPLLGPLVGGLLAMASTFGSMIPVVGQFLPAINPIIGIIAGLIATSPQLRESLGGAFESLGPVFGQLLGAVKPLLEAFGGFAGMLGNVLARIIPIVVDLVSSLLGTVAELIPVLLPVVSAVMQVALTLANALIPILGPVSTLIQAVVGVVASLIPVLMPVIMLVLDLAMKLIGALMPVIPPIIGIFTQLVTMIAGLLVPILTALLPPIMSIIEALFPLLPAVTDVIMIFVELISAVLEPLMPLITTVAELIGTVLVAALDILMPIVELLVGAFTGLVSYLKGPLGEAIKWISGLFEGLIGFLQPILDGLGKVTSMVGDGIGGALGGLKGMLGLSGGGVIGYAGGGTVLGGYSPGVDRIPALLSPGESVLVPELTRALGPRNIMAANYAASGRTAGSGPARASIASAAPSGGGGVGVMVAEGAVQISVVAQPGQSATDIGEAVAEAVNEVFEDMKRRGY